MQITLSVPKEYLARLDETARVMGLSRSALIRLRVSGMSSEALDGGLMPAPAADLAALERVAAPYRETRGAADAPPPGYVLITVMESDVGKDAWMSPADAGV